MRKKLKRESLSPTKPNPKNENRNQIPDHRRPSRCVKRHRASKGRRNLAEKSKSHSSRYSVWLLPSSKMSKTTPHDGPRKGAGRKAGSGKGRTYVSKTVAMSKESWAKLDRQRGTISRGKFIEALLPAKGSEKKYEVVCDSQKGEIHLIELTGKL